MTAAATWNSGVSQAALNLMTSREMREAITTPQLMTWAKGTKVVEAPQPEAIGHVLVRSIHKHLEGWKIIYLFKEKMKTRDRTTLGKASKADPKLTLFTDAAFVMEINWQTWVIAKPFERVALIDHELSHYGIDEDEESGELTPVILSHDLEEFRAIVDRWGLWRPDVELFAASCAQYELELQEDKQNPGTDSDRGSLR
jgi:hypothetical protein